MTNPESDYQIPEELNQKGPTTVFLTAEDKEKWMPLVRLSGKKMSTFVRVAVNFYIDRNIVNQPEVSKLLNVVAVWDGVTPSEIVDNVLTTYLRKRIHEIANEAGGPIDQN